MKWSSRFFHKLANRSNELMEFRASNVIGPTIPSGSTPNTCWVYFIAHLPEHQNQSTTRLAIAWFSISSARQAPPCVVLPRDDRAAWGGVRGYGCMAGAAHACGARLCRHWSQAPARGGRNRLTNRLTNGTDSCIISDQGQVTEAYKRIQTEGEAAHDEVFWPVSESACFVFFSLLCMITAFWRFSFCAARIDGFSLPQYNFLRYAQECV